MADSTYVLNQLLGAEETMLLRHLLHAAFFVSRLEAKEVDAVTRMGAESREHQGWLTEAILARDGAPRIPRPNIRAGDLNFNDLHTQLRAILEDYAAIVDMYRAAGRQLSADPEAAAMVGRILVRHEASLKKLQQLTAQARTA